LLVGAIVGVRVWNFVAAVTGRNPISVVPAVVDPPAGSIPWKLKHGQRVNILLLGYGGVENDAPYLTDSIMVASIDPASKRIALVSIPRDLWVGIDAFADGRKASDKVNAAFDIGTRDADFPGKRREYTGRDGGGHLAEHVVSQVTGLTFDKYAGVDFVAFRDVVDALGGIQVHMDFPLDDCHYPDYKGGYMNGGVPDDFPCPNPRVGIHFRAGDYQVNGEQALELARSRKAIQPEQSSDFGRARRQQMIMAAIKKKSTSINGIVKAPQLMDALQKNFKTDMDVNDLRALYDWSQGLPDQNTLRGALTDGDFLDAYWLRRGSCGPVDTYVLCPEDPTFKTIHRYFANVIPDPRALGERAPVQVANATFSSDDLGDRLTSILRAYAAPQQPAGMQLADPLRLAGRQRTAIYDFSGGKFPGTAQWLSSLFAADVLPAGQASPPAPQVAGERTDGLVVVVARDYGLRWYGEGG
jgi:anionic cell wall polymer biosynthesis LytR-Cps2A-Psr (LCP) family protein